MGNVLHLYEIFSDQMSERRIRVVILLAKLSGKWSGLVFWLTMLSKLYRI